MSNSVNWRGIFGSFGFSFLFLIALVGSANAAPVCKSQVNGDQATVTITDTGMVWSDGAQPPVDLMTYLGTGRTSDIAASCSDNPVFCQVAKWFLRFPKSKQGWPRDGDLGNDQRAVACKYDPEAKAQTCAFKITDSMKTATAVNGKVLMHFATKLPSGQVISAYQPESGCPTEKDERGNTHTILVLTPAN